MRTAEIAARVLEIIPDESHWIKGFSHDSQGRHCVLGGLDVIMREEAVDSGTYLVCALYAGRFAAAFLATARELYPDLCAYMREDASAGPATASFNDDPDVTYGHVRTVLEKIRAREDAA